ncbi:hypothetical protein [Sphingobium naphthae]|uniref:Uncharacterized protein n=1 Tax=Sphingobium naphthae TaxID=1886786 RepID=A0ABU3ZUF0_9SPHN|nr:hypothetical protein [Sphingobium naphthae]MDV5823093.1 hypothetical protein [Sphingobium naphthae]
MNAPTPPDLLRRLSRRLEQGKGIQLSPNDLDLLVASGAYDMLTQAAADYQRNLCLQRSARSRSISGEAMRSTGAPAEPTSKSSGTTRKDAGNDPLARARTMLRKDASPSIAST